MIILGIDPGSRVSGFGVLEIEGRKVHYLDSGILKFDKINVFVDRLPVIYEEVRKLVKQYRPDEIALESLIHVKNISSLAKLAQARGAMIAAMDGQRIFEYAPTLIKSVVTGNGHASKESVEKILLMTLGKIKVSSHDESDALAIAFCHSLLRKRETKSNRKKNLRESMGQL